MSEKKIKILMTTMVGIIALMIAIFVVKDISDSNANNNEESIKKIDKDANKKYDKIKGTIIQIDGEKSFVIRDYDGEEYSLSSENSIEVCNEYGDAIKVSKLVVGDVVIAGYDKKYENLEYIYLDEEITRYEDLDKFSLGKNNKYIKIDDKKYRLSENTYVYSAGERISFYEIDEKDKININILDKDVISVNIIKGHGFINLINFKDYIGEKLLINDDDAYDIEEEMKIAVSEGENLIIIKTDKLKGSKLLEIKRGETSNVDVSKIKFEKKKEGYVTFDVEPESARVYINGKLYSNKANILLDYGSYNYNVELTGYDSIVGALLLDEVTKTIQIKLSEKVTAAPSAQATLSSSPDVTFVTKEPTNSEEPTPTVTPTPTQAPAETAGVDD